MTQWRYRMMTARQLQVAELLSAGMTNLQICHRLNLSLGTVKCHVAAIYSRLGVESRATAALACRHVLTMKSFDAAPLASALGYQVSP